jgi:hypothetical protein
MNERLKVISGGFVAILGHEIAVAPEGSNMADMIESAIYRACRQVRNETLNEVEQLTVKFPGLGELRDSMNALRVP